jgi:catechol 2,3-dioxygenase-like lactoylglutathione lyase family enzyme
MANGARLSGAAVAVRDLARSTDFYRELFDLQVDASSAQAVLLSARGGDRLALRVLSGAPHVGGGIGVLFLVWTAESPLELDRCEAVLRSRGAFVSRSVESGWDVVAGRDPDDLRVILVFSVAGGAEWSVVPSRIYEY